MPKNPNRPSRVNEAPEGPRLTTNIGSLIEAKRSIVSSTVSDKGQFYVLPDAFRQAHARRNRQAN